MNRPSRPGRRQPKARTGCWTCKKRKVKCSEEKPTCRACARLQLPCQYGLKLQWGEDTPTVGRDCPAGLPGCGSTRLASDEVPPPGLEIRTFTADEADGSDERPSTPALPVHFVHFTIGDFQSKEERDAAVARHALLAPVNVFPPQPLVAAAVSETSTAPDDSDRKNAFLLPDSSLILASPDAQFCDDFLLNPSANVFSPPFSAFPPSTPPPLTESGSPSSSETLLFPDSGLILLDEPSWFPPLDMPTVYDELLFTFYAREICPRCTMYDDSSNGFRTIIIPMSANHPCVLHSILAVAAFYRRNEDPCYHIQALEQKEKSLIHLRRSFPDDPERRHEEMISAAIMLCVFEIKDGSGPNWDKHLNGGRSILQSKAYAIGGGRIGDPGSEHDRPVTWSSGISWWANKFFGYQCVNGAAAAVTSVKASRHADAVDAVDDSQLALLSPVFWLSQGMGVQEVDGFMGCSSELMAITAEMSSLVQTADCVSAGVVQDLERRLFELQQRSRHTAPLVLSETTRLADALAVCIDPHSCQGQATDGVALSRARMLILTAESRRQAALIFLYTCLRGWPVTHAAVQSRVAKALACIAAVAVLMRSEESPVWGMTPLVWPLFVAGAASMGESHRFQVLETFSLLRSSKCLGNAARAESVVASAWKQHDISTAHQEPPCLSRLFLRPNENWPLSLG